MRSKEYCQLCSCYSCYYDPTVCDEEGCEAVVPCTNCDEEGAIMHCDAWKAIEKMVTLYEDNS